MDAAKVSVTRMRHQFFIKKKRREHRTALKAFLSFVKHYVALQFATGRLLRQASPFTPVGSNALFPTCQTSSKMSNLPALNMTNRQVVQSHSRFCLFSETFMQRLHTRCKASNLYLRTFLTEGEAGDVLPVSMQSFLNLFHGGGGLLNTVSVISDH